MLIYTCTFNFTYIIFHKEKPVRVCRFFFEGFLGIRQNERSVNLKQQHISCWKYHLQFQNALMHFSCTNWGLILGYARHSLIFIWEQLKFLFIMMYIVTFVLIFFFSIYTMFNNSRITPFLQKIQFTTKQVGLLSL